MEELAERAARQWSSWSVWLSSESLSRPIRMNRFARSTTVLIARATCVRRTGRATGRQQPAKPSGGGDGRSMRSRVTGWCLGGGDCEARLSVWMPLELQWRPVWLVLQNRVLLDAQLDCLDAAQVAALADEFCLLAVQINEDLEDPIIHLTQQPRIVRPAGRLSRLLHSPPKKKGWSLFAVPRVLGANAR